MFYYMFQYMSTLTVMLKWFIDNEGLRRFKSSQQLVLKYLVTVKILQHHKIKQIYKANI